MADKPTAKKQPFVIEPLNWVAPDSARRDDPESQSSQGEPENKSDSRR